MTARVITGSKQEIAQKVASLEGEVREAIVFIEEPAGASPSAQDVPATVEEMFKEMEPYTVKVGDTPSDLQEGTRAGCGMVVGVTSGSHTEEELKGHPHTALIGSVRDLPGLL